MKREHLGFWSFAKRSPSALALVAPDGSQLTFAELAANANRIANGLRALGLRKGDTVAFALPSGSEVVALCLACLQVGLYVVPLNTHLVGPEIAYIVTDSETAVFVGHERYAAECQAAVRELDLAPERRFVVGSVAGFRSFDELTAGQPETSPPQRSLGSVMNYTAGTTGRPKGVRRDLPDLDPDDAGMQMGGWLLLLGLALGDDNVQIVGSPLYHTAVLRFALGGLDLGHTLVLMDKWLPEEMLRLIERYRVTYSHMVPTQFHRLLQLPDETRSRYDLSSLRHMIHAAAPCPVEIKRQMLDWWGPVVDEYYGSTEGGGTLATAADWLRRPGTVGRAWPGSEVAIFDADGTRVREPNTIGNVYMAMGARTFVYYKDESKTKTSRIGDYFTVGDVGFLDEDGWLFLRGRGTEVIISGGVNIYPTEIEGVLLNHPSVHDAAVFGVPNPDWGEEVKAVVELTKGVDASDATVEEILAFCAGKLARYKTPRSVDFIDEMPRDPNGKLYKRRLRDPYWADATSTTGSESPS
jgi:long-chain acyl-CoA synthetase